MDCFGSLSACLSGSAENRPVEHDSGISAKST